MKRQRIKSNTISKGRNTEKILIENSIALQKVMVSLSSRFDNLTNQISKLLELFEKSAEALSKKDFTSGKEIKDSGKIIEKIENLANQNKVIAQGLTLMHERMPGQPAPQVRAPPAQQPPIQKPLVVPTPEMNPQSTQEEGYQKSISSKFKPLPKR